MSRILIYTLADKQNGFGHVMRQLVLASALLEREVRVDFWTESGTPGYKRLLTSPHDIYSGPPNPISYSGIIIDLEHGPELDFLKLIRSRYESVIVFGGVGYSLKNRVGEYAALCDLQVYQGELFDHPSTAHALNGPNYLILNPRYAHCQPNLDGPIVVSMGGSDPHNMTGKIMETLIEYRRDVRFVLGPAADWSKVRWAQDGKNKRIQMTPSHPSYPNANIQDPFYYDLYFAPDSLVNILEGASLCITATGMTAYESLAAGVPCLLVSWSADHVRTAQALEDKRVAWNMGLWNELEQKQFKVYVQTAFDKHCLRQEMSRRARVLIDGKGAGRVANRIVQLVGVKTA